MTDRSEADVDVSIVIVSYNTKDRLAKCLMSIYKNVEGISFEVLVSDNHSLDGSPELIEKEFPQAKSIRNCKNLGFSKATNKALALSKGSYAFLLNSDTVVLPFSIPKIMNFLRNHREVGVVGAKLLYPDGTVQKTARHFPTPMAAIFGRKSVLTRLLPNNKYSRRYLMYTRDYPEEPFEVDWVSGAAMMVKREVMERVGLLDEAFFMYWEDADWCCRIKQNGWKVFCLPSAEIIHYEGESSKNNQFKLIIQFHKSVYRFYCKHYIRYNLRLLRTIVAFVLTVRAILLCMVNLPRFLNRN